MPLFPGAKTSQQYREEREQKKAAAQSATVHHGGGVARTGYNFLEGGEVVLPKRFQFGGIVEAMKDLQMTSKMDFSPGPDLAALNNGPAPAGGASIASDIKSAIQEALASATVKIDENARVPVEVGDSKVPVDVGDAKVSLDAGDAASTLSAAITQALSSVKLDVGGGAVGADKSDQLSATLDQIRDDLISVKTDLTDKITMIETRTIDQNITNSINMIENTVAGVRIDVQQHGQDISLLGSEIRREKSLVQGKLNDLYNKIGQALNLGGRPFGGM